MGEDYVGYDEHGRRDIYNNFRNQSGTVFGATYDQPKPNAIKRNYDDPKVGKQNMERQNRSSDFYSGESDHVSEDSSRSPKDNDDPYFTYNNGDDRRY